MDAMMKRRTFLKAAAAAGGGLWLGWMPDAQAQAAGGQWLNAWIEVHPNNRVTIMVSQAEMGQGVETTLPAIVADEMDADWTLVERRRAPVGEAFQNPVYKTQFTGNAESTRTFWPVLRKLGAGARAMLVAAAAARWGVEAESCRTERSFVLHPATGRRLSYGELAAAAAKLKVPAEPKLKTPEEWTLLRKPQRRTDLLAKVTGRAVFGIDVEVPGMVYAAIRHVPAFGGRFATLDSLIAKDNQKGVIAVVPVPDGVAVVADTYWRARRALDGAKLEVVAGPRFDSASVAELYRKTMEGDAWKNALSVGDAAAVLGAAPAAQVAQAEYGSAFQSHSPMEPMNCVADVAGDRCRILAPTQGQTMVVAKVAKALGIPEGNIAVERNFLGGGFGRRLIADYAVEAALCSKAVGRPVKLIWSREEEIRHDTYRPAVLNRLRASLGADGLPAALEHRLVSGGILAAVLAEPISFNYPQVDPSCLEGATAEGFRYGIPAYRLDAHILELPMPTMVWRTTGYGPNIFAIESFVDELAHQAKADPIDYRRRLLARGKENERGIAVLERLAELMGRAEAAPGRGRGVAYSYCFNTHIAQMVDASVAADGTLDLHRVLTVVDAGYVLDPDIARANIEGGINWGLTQALLSEVTFRDSRVQQSNFHDFKVTALPEAPKTEFHWIDSGASPGGIGEVGPVTLAPALANAIFAASGKRLRTLPLSHHGIATRWSKQFA